MKKRNIIMWSIITLYVVIALIAVNWRRKQVICSSIDVVFKDSLKDNLIDKKEIIDILEAKQGKIIGKPIEDLNLAVLEAALNSQAPVKHAEIYKTIDGNLKVEISQRTPILRIMTDSLSYYIDIYGAVMPLPTKYRPRVLPATGFIKHKTKQITDLYILAKFIYSNNFWKAQIQQIYVNKKSEFELIPRVGAQRIYFGGIAHFRNKFSKLLALYQYGFHTIDWNQFKAINLKFKNQVVCIR